MLRKSSTLLLLALLIPFFASAQNSRVAAPKIDDNKVSTVTASYDKSGNGSTLIPYVLVDTIGNNYGPAIGELNPLAYDPWSKTLAVVRRGGGVAGTLGGEIWYNYSTDMGATWVRSAAAINGQALTTQRTGRYPSMAISNPTKGTTLDATTGLFVWAQLNPSFQDQGYGVDQPIGAGIPSYFIETPTLPVAFSSGSIAWASDDAAQPYLFWANGPNTTDQSGNLLYVWRTTDFQTVERLDFDTTDMVNGTIFLGGASKNGVQYLGLLGVWNTTPDDYPSWMPGYAKSTDAGATWTEFAGPDHRTIPALAAFDVLWDFKTGDEFVSYQGDMNVDANGNVHFLVQYADTNVTPYNAALVHLYETAPGTWAADIVQENLNLVIPGLEGDENPGLGQMGICAYLAMDAEGTAMFAQWVGSPNPTDTVLDVYGKVKGITGNTWGPLVNLTGDDRNNSSAHLAPVLDKGANGYTAFSMFSYTLASTGPVSDAIQPTGVYVGAYNFQLTGVDENPAAELKFDLEQNYPNPFNPATSIRYSVNKSEFVTLKVYDMLGKEVATLVNSVQEPGQKLVNFDGSKLSSGMYIYKLSVGNLTSSKKMMLMK